MFYLMTHSTHFIYGYMASDIIMVKTKIGLLLLVVVVVVVVVIVVIVLVLVVVVIIIAVVVICLLFIIKFLKINIKEIFCFIDERVCKI